MHQPLHGRALGAQPWANPRWRGEEQLQQHPAPWTSRECLVLGYSQRTTPLDCPCGLQSAAQAGTESHFTFLDNSEINTQTQTCFGHSRTRSGPRRRKKPIYSLDTKLVLWQHGKTLFNLLKWYTWSNSWEVTTFPGTEPKHYLLVTLGKEDWKQCVPVEQGLPCLTCTHSSGQVPQELPGEQLCLGTQPPKFPKPLPSLQNDSTAAAQKDFQEIKELTVLSSVPSTRELLLRIEKENPNPILLLQQGALSSLPALGAVVKCFSYPTSLRCIKAHTPC